MTRTSRRGFTLVELLVVIGIIAVLISILLPTISRARRSAKTISGLSNLKQIGLGLRLYAQDYKDSMPYGWMTNPDGTVSLWWYYVNQVFNKNAGIRSGSGPGALTLSMCSKIFIDPQSTGNPQKLTYSAHARIMPDEYEIRAAAGGDPSSAEYRRLMSKFKPYKFSDLYTDNAVVMDGAQFTTGSYVDDAFPLLENIDGGRIYSGYYYMGNPGSEDAAADQFWYRDGNPFATDPQNGYYLPIDPGLNVDSVDNFSDVRWRQRTPAIGVKPANAQYPLGFAVSAANVLFGDGHCETVNHKDFRRISLMLRKP